MAATAKHGAALRRLDRLATLMDAAVSIPGTRLRVGLDALIGLIPVVGDGVAAAVALYIVIEAYRLQAPARLLLRMLGNIAVDFLVGLVPVFGDIADIGFRANRRNVELLRRHLALREAEDKE